jgi:hypothetical protein
MKPSTLAPTKTDVSMVDEMKGLAAALSRPGTQLSRDVSFLVPSSGICPD